MANADRRWAAHLLRRAGFGGSADELDSYAALGYGGAVDRLLAPGSVDDSATGNLISGLDATLNAATQIVDGQALWLVRMLYTQRPLQEKMALFWHNHFATGVQKVRDPGMMYQQNELFLTQGLGKFDDLLAGVARDPAMIFWLDNNTNRKGHPNENWGREVMELFTIGIGNYTEQDVKENARAFTGWSATRTGTFQFLPRQHDDGVKTVLGHTGNLDGADVLPILAGLRQTGQFLARKMWRWFVNDTPSSAGVERLADVYMQSGHDLSAMLRALFLSPDFQDEANYYQTVKSPPEFIIGVLKLIGAGSALRDNLTLPLVRSLARACDAMGMVLFNPPNVGGWPGGRTWINPGTYFARTTWVEQVLNAQAGGGPLADVPGLVRAAGWTGADAIVDGMLDLALQTAPADLRASLISYLGGNTSPLKLYGALRLLLCSPAYQLN
jgi:uncharacterized protein (DUF1800 family)